MLLPSEWKAIREQVIADCNDTCPHCGAEKVRLNVQWDYDMDTQVQTLTGIGAVCGDCGLVHHFQAVASVEVENRAKEHLMQVNGWTLAETNRAIAQARALYAERSACEWTMDASWLWNRYAISDASKARLLRKVRVADERTRLKMREAQAKDARLRRLYGAEVPVEAYTRTEAQNRVHAIRAKIAHVVANGKGDWDGTALQLKQQGLRIEPAGMASGELAFRVEGDDALISSRRVLGCTSRKGVAEALRVSPKDFATWLKAQSALAT